MIKISSKNPPFVQAGEEVDGVWYCKHNLSDRLSHRTCVDLTHLMPSSMLINCYPREAAITDRHLTYRTEITPLLEATWNACWISTFEVLLNYITLGVTYYIT